MRRRSEIISASMVTICNGAGSARLRASLAVEPLENVRSMAPMPACLTKHDRVVNTICKTCSTNKLRHGVRFEQSVPRIGALWCASCPLRAESGMIPNVIRQTEQRGRGRLQNGQAVAFISRSVSGSVVFEKRKLALTLFAALAPRGSLITLLQ